MSPDTPAAKKAAAERDAARKDLKRDRLLMRIAMLVAAISMIGAIDGHNRAGDAQDSADANSERLEISRASECDAVRRALSTRTVRLLYVDGPEPMGLFRERMNGLRNQLVGAKDLECQEYGIKNFGRRRLVKLIAVDRVLGIAISPEREIRGAAASAPRPSSPAGGGSSGPASTPGSSGGSGGGSTEKPSGGGDGGDGSTGVPGPPGPQGPQGDPGQTTTTPASPPTVGGGLGQTVDGALCLLNPQRPGCQ